MRKLNSSSTGYRISQILFSLSILLIGLTAVISLRSTLGRSNAADQGSTLTASYLEDPSGTLSLGEILSAESLTAPNSVATQWRSGSGFKPGSSRSVWWVQIKTEDILSIVKGAEQFYLSVVTPSVEQVRVYLPAFSNQSSYQMLESGWGVSKERHSDEGFSSPTFLLSREQVSGKYVYLRLSSPYTQNYTFRAYPLRDFSRIQKVQTTMISFFIGFIAAVAINNFVQYATQHASMYLSYVLYLFSMVIYQGSVLGFFRLYFGKFAEILVAGIAPLGMAMFVSALYFFRNALSTKKNFPLAHKLSNIVLIIFLVLLVAFLSGYRYEANLLIILFANLASLLILVITFFAIRRNIPQAKYLMLGWIITLLVSFVFNARTIGLLPNNELTSFIILLPAGFEAVILSLGVAEQMEQIRREKENALRLYRVAEEQVLTKESAFLQAQMKPHFFYNTLNVIEALCYMDGKRAGELIQDFSKFLRHTFDSNTLKHYISVQEELEFVRAYVKIEQARFPGKFDVVYDVTGAEELLIPPLLLQPLIENAIRHGIRELDRKGTVSLRGRVLEDTCEISVEDDGIGMTEKQIREALSGENGVRSSVGLSNIQKRLWMFYGTDLLIQSAPGKGTKVTVKLPVRGGDKP